MHALSGTKQCDSILLFFFPTKCVSFYLKADEDSMKIICVLFIHKLRFRYSYHSKNLQHFLIDSNFFQAVTLKQCIFILNNKQEQEINY